MTPLTLAAPHWLLLLVPAAVAWWLARPGGLWLRAMRAVVYGLVVLAMCEPRLVCRSARAPSSSSPTAAPRCPATRGRGSSR